MHGRTAIPAALALTLLIAAPARATDFTVSRREGVHPKRTTIKVAKGAGTVLVGAFTNLTHHSPCTPGRELVIEPNGRIHSG